MLQRYPACSVRVKIPGKERKKQKPHWHCEVSSPAHYIFHSGQKGKCTFYRDSVQLVSPYPKKQFLEEVHKAGDTETIVCHPESLWQAEPSEQEDTGGTVNTQRGQHVSGLLPKCWFERGQREHKQRMQPFSRYSVQHTQRAKIEESLKGKLKVTFSLCPSPPPLITGVPAKVIFRIVITLLVLTNDSKRHCSLDCSLVGEIEKQESISDVGPNYISLWFSLSVSFWLPRAISFPPGQHFTFLKKPTLLLGASSLPQTKSSLVPWTVAHVMWFPYQSQPGNY